MRFLLSALFLTLAACSSGGDTDSNTDSNAEATSGGDNDSIVGYWQANKYEHTKNLPVVVSQIWEEAGTHYIDHEMNDSPIKQSIDDSDALTLSENGLFPLLIQERCTSSQQPMMVTPCNYYAMAEMVEHTLELIKRGLKK